MTFFAFIPSFIVSHWDTWSRVVVYIVKTPPVAALLGTPLRSVAIQYDSFAVNTVYNVQFLWTQMSFNYMFISEARVLLHYIILRGVLNIMQSSTVSWALEHRVELTQCLRRHKSRLCGRTSVTDDIRCSRVPNKASTESVELRTPQSYCWFICLSVTLGVDTMPHD